MENDKSKLYVAWVNPNEPVKKTQYQCGICTKQFSFIDGQSGYYQRPSKDHISDEYLLICSETCHEKGIESGIIHKFLDYEQ